MKRKHTVIRSMVMLLMLVGGMMLAAPPGVAQFELPQGAMITSATLFLTGSYSSNSGETVSVHRVEVPWEELTVTWNSFYLASNPFDPLAATSFPSMAGPIEVDVTGLVQEWVYGTHGNHGLLLKQELTGITTYRSSDDPASIKVHPGLEICYTVDGSEPICIFIQRGSYGEAVDTYIWVLYPDANYGLEPNLFTGLLASREKQSLLWFDVPKVPSDEGCTPGGWQGGNLEWRWNQPFDPDFDPEYDNPFYHDTAFNSFFTPVASLDGLSMMDLVGTGGKKDTARKAARSLVAAYLNASHAGVNYPLTTDELRDKWDAAVGNGNFLDLHKQLDGYNNLGCQVD